MRWPKPACARGSNTSGRSPRPRRRDGIWPLALAGVAVGAGLRAPGAGGGSRAGRGPRSRSAIALAGVQPLRKALNSLRRRTLDIHVLMLLAVAGALALGEWAEAATVVWLFAVSQWLEVRTMERAREAIRAVMTLAPTEALREARRPRAPARRSTRVPLGAIVLVAPGEKIPLDGVVVAGQSDVNQAPITGESLPVDRGPGDEVFAGTINGHGALEVRVTRAVRDTTLARIVHLVEAAQAQRAPAQQFIDRFARWYTPAVVAVAARGVPGARAALGRAGRRVGLPRARAAGRRLPVRARDLHAGVDRRGAGHRRAPRRAHQGRRAPGAAGRRARRGVRQDRHADARRAGGRDRRRVSPMPATRDRRAGGGRAPSRRAPSIRSRAPSSTAARARGVEHGGRQRRHARCPAAAPKAAGAATPCWSATRA